MFWFESDISFTGLWRFGLQMVLFWDAVQSLGGKDLAGGSRSAEGDPWGYRTSVTSGLILLPDRLYQEQLLHHLLPPLRYSPAPSAKQLWTNTYETMNHNKLFLPCFCQAFLWEQCQCSWCMWQCILHTVSVMHYSWTILVSVMPAFYFMCCFS